MEQDAMFLVSCWEISKQIDCLLLVGLFVTKILEKPRKNFLSHLKPMQCLSIIGAISGVCLTRARW